MPGERIVYPATSLSLSLKPNNPPSSLPPSLIGCPPRSSCCCVNPRGSEVSMHSLCHQPDSLAQVSPGRRWFVFLVGMLESMVWSGTVFGWASLVHVMKLQGIYDNLCSNGDDDDDDGRVTNMTVSYSVTDAQGFFHAPEVSFGVSVCAVLTPAYLCLQICVGDVGNTLRQVQLEIYVLSPHPPHNRFTTFVDRECCVLKTR